MHWRLIVLLTLTASTPVEAQTERTLFDPPQKAELSASAVDVPLVKAGDFYFADVQVNGSTARFTLETGANFVAIGERLAQRLGLHVDTVLGPGGRATGVTTIATLRLGGATLSGVRAQVMPMFNDPTFAGEGIISLPLLREFLTTIDLRNRRLHLERGTLPAPNGRELLGFSGRDPGGRVDIPIVVGGVALPAVLDTRSFIWLTLPDSLSAQIPLAATPRSLGEAAGPTMGVFQMRGARAVGTLQVGELTVNQPVLTFRNRPGVVLGVPFIEQLVITIDQRSQRVRVLPSDKNLITVPMQAWETTAANADANQGRSPMPRQGSAPRASAPGQRTMGFNLAGVPGGSLSVRNVVPGSGADKAGLKEGDQLVAFDGTPAADMNATVFRGAATRGKPVKVVVKRDDKQLEFTIEPYVVP